MVTGSEHNVVVATDRVRMGTRTRPVRYVYHYKPAERPRVRTRRRSAARTRRRLEHLRVFACAERCADRLAELRIRHDTPTREALAGLDRRGFEREPAAPVRRRRVRPLDPTRRAAARAEDDPHVLELEASSGKARHSRGLRRPTARGRHVRDAFARFDPDRARFLTVDRKWQDRSRLDDHRSRGVGRGARRKSAAASSRA